MEQKIGYPNLLDNKMKNEQFDIYSPASTKVFLVIQYRRSNYAIFLLSADVTTLD